MRSNGLALDLGGQKQRALLALLLVEANRVVSSDRLIDALWEEEPTPTAGKALQGYVSQLRKLLGPERIATKAPGYLLRVHPGELDLDRFDSLRTAGRVEEALALWRGAPLADVAYHRFAQNEIARLEELRLAAVEDRIDGDLERGCHVELVAELEALVADHPARERFVGQLLLALYRSGRQADALDAYRAARHTLVEELGIEPGQRLRRLQQKILRQDPELEPLAGAADSEAPTLFVGRERELSELTGALEDALAGRGRLVLLEGEPGIGKSFLADEFLRFARRRGVAVLVGRAWEAGGAPAYWPWVQSLRAHVGDGDPHTSELSELFPAAGETSGVGPDAARFRLFDAVASFLRTAAEQRPTVLFLDDLHAADAPSLLLLQFVARELPTMRVLILGAYRSVDPVPAEVAAALTVLVREPVAQVIALTGLTEEDVASYVSLVRHGPASSELVSRLQSKTEGNPLFVAEMVRLLGDEEDVSASRTPLPQSVRSVIAWRLTHLSDACRDVLLLASVLGREFTPTAVARAVGLPEAETLDLLDEAMHAAVVSDVHDTPGRLRFAHVLFRDTLYESVTAARRIGLHRRVVDALESLYGVGSGQHSNELALHALAGSEFERALSYARRGGDRALALLAYEEAVRLYELALDALALSLEDDATRCELLLALGDARTRAGEGGAAKRAFMEAVEIARRVGLRKHFAGAAVGYGGRILWSRAGGDHRLVPLLEEAIHSLGDADPDLSAMLLARLSGALRDEPSRERRDALSREAIELARRTGNASSLAYALGARGHAIAAPDTTDELLSLGSELCATARSIGDRERLAAGHAVRTMALLIRGEVMAAESEVAAGSLLAEEIRQAPQLWDALSTRALLAFNAGRFDEAEKLADEAYEFGKRALPDAALPIHVLQKYALCDFRGGLERLEPDVRALVEVYPARGVFRCALVYLHARTARTPEAERALHELATVGFTSLAFDQEWLFGMSLLAEAAVLVSDAASAAELYPLLEPWGDLNAVDQAEGTRGSVWRYLGLLSRLLDRSDEAASQFEAALVANERMGARPWLARTQEDYASLLAERDPGRGRELLARARQGYRELGLENHDSS